VRFNSDQEFEDWFRRSAPSVEPDPDFSGRLFLKLLRHIDKGKDMNSFERWLWGVAERADWYGWRPRWFWSRVLHHLDNKAGLTGKAPVLDPSVQSARREGVKSKLVH